MASIIPRPGGRHEIQLRVGPSRHTIRLGKCARHRAESIKVRIEALNFARENNVNIDPETALWLEGIDAKLRDKLHRAGLASAKAQPSNMTLGALIEAFLAAYRKGVPETKVSIGVALKRLVGYFGPDKPVRSITADAANDCRAALAAKLEEPTVSTTVKKARQLWKDAVKRGLVAANVWSEVYAGRQDNEGRANYISRETTQRILAECESDEDRLIVALSRFGGLRSPSEVLRLRRADILWESNRFRVRGKGKKDRVVPIFPDLRPYLEASVAGAALSTAPLVIEWAKVSKTTRRDWMLMWIAKAGIKEPWPRLFHNLRASCETDLVAAGHPVHVVGKWLGNTEEIARRHYLMPTEKDFERATESDVTDEERIANKRPRRRGTAS